MQVNNINPNFDIVLLQRKRITQAFAHPSKFITLLGESLPVSGELNNNKIQTTVCHCLYKLNKK